MHVHMIFAVSGLFDMTYKRPVIGDCEFAVAFSDM
jgi:hypothetical protein